MEILLYVKFFDKFENDTKLVHYDGGCYRRGASRKLSRLQIKATYRL